MPVDRRSVLLSCVAGAASWPLIGNAASVDFTPEMFGAKGDGVTNDTVAFRRMAQAVNTRGGGTVVLRPRTYLVGLQTPRLGGYSFAPASPLYFTRCDKSLVIRGNGAVLKCAAGLRYGTFDPRTGERFDHAMPFTESGYTATPYDYMLAARDCSGSVEIEDLELDGNAGALRIGGPWGDTGWQIPAVGLFLADNRGGETVRNVRSHRHAQDGMMLRGGPHRAGDPPRSFTGVRCELNGRQGCSLIGGGGYVFRDCRFANTGMGALVSAPAAGFDLEAEGAPIRNVRFVNCEFSGNAGVGMVADSGDTEDVHFDACRFVGTANWSVWPRKPLFRFAACQFVGPIVQCWGDEDPARATQFHRCTVTDTAAKPLKGKPQVAPGPIANLNVGQNVLFKACRFTVTHGWALPWSTQAIYEDCVMRQVGGTQGYPRGTYRGNSIIAGNVDLYSSRIVGSVTVNGTRHTG